MRLGEDVKNKRRLKKRDAQLIIIVAIFLAIVTMSVSYSAFFSVQSVSTIQEIETGSLDISITVDTSNSVTTSEEQLYPTSESVISTGDSYYTTLTLKNTGSVEAEYSVSITYDYDALNDALGTSYSDSALLDYLVSFDYLNVGIYDSTSGAWVNFASSGTVNYPTISSLTPTSDDSYAFPILRDAVSVGGSHVYKIYVWLDEDTPISEIGNYVYLKLIIKCAAGTETITEEVTV